MTAAPLTLTLTAAINDPSLRAVHQVIAERFGALPIERVLVWHLASTQPDAVPFVAELLGLVGPEFRGGGGPPRELVARGVELRRRKGTVWALREVMRGLGYGEIEHVRGSIVRCDGTIDCDGERLCGGDGNPGLAMVYVTVPAPLSVDQAQVLWDVAAAWKRLTVHIVLGVRIEGYSTFMFSARPTTGTTHDPLS